MLLLAYPERLPEPREYLVVQLLRRGDPEVMAIPPSILLHPGDWPLMYAARRPTRFRATMILMKRLRSGSAIPIPQKEGPISIYIRGMGSDATVVQDLM